MMYNHNSKTKLGGGGELQNGEIFVLPCFGEIIGSIWHALHASNHNHIIESQLYALGS